MDQDESAALKQALKHAPNSPRLAADAALHTAESCEAIEEVLAGYEEADPGSWVAHYLAKEG